MAFLLLPTSAFQPPQPLLYNLCHPCVFAGVSSFCFGVGMTALSKKVSLLCCCAYLINVVLVGKEILLANEAQSGKETTQAKPEGESTASIPLHMRKSPPEELAAKAVVPASVLGAKASASCSSVTNEDLQPDSVVIPEPGNDGKKIFKDLTFVLVGSFPMVLGGIGEGDLVGGLRRSSM